MVSLLSSEGGEGSTNFATSSPLSQFESSLATQSISAPVTGHRSPEREDAYGVLTYVPISFEEADPITDPPIELKSNTEIEVERMVKEVQQEVQHNIHGLPKKPKTPQGHLAVLPLADIRREIRAEIKNWRGKRYRPAYGWELGKQPLLFLLRWFTTANRFEARCSSPPPFLHYCSRPKFSLNARASSPAGPF